MFQFLASFDGTDEIFKVATVLRVADPSVSGLPVEFVAGLDVRCETDVGCLRSGVGRLCNGV